MDTVIGRSGRYRLERAGDPRQPVRDLVELAQGQGSLLQRGVVRVEMSMEEAACRIALIASPWLPVPPPAYGGTEVVLDSARSRGLQAAGREVVLAAAGDSSCPVERTWVYRGPGRRRWGA